MEVLREAMPIQEFHLEQNSVVCACAVNGVIKQQLRYRILHRAGYAGRGRRQGGLSEGLRDSPVMKALPTQTYIECSGFKGRPRKPVKVCRQCRRKQKCRAFQAYLQPELPFRFLSNSAISKCPP